MKIVHIAFRAGDLIVRAGSVVWLVGHFAFTLLYVMPFNPIKMALDPLLNATIGTYFGQNWCLFAPDPLVSDHALLVRCVSRDETDHVKALGLPADGWHDISTPLWLRFQRNRFTAYDRLVRPQSNAIRQYLGGGPAAWEWKKACDRGAEDSCKTYRELVKQGQLAAGEYLRRAGSSFCLATTQDPGRVAYVALRLRQTSPVPWSKRYDDKFERKVEDFDLAVYPVERDVVPLRVFRVGGES